VHIIPTRVTRYAAVSESHLVGLVGFRIAAIRPARLQSLHGTEGQQPKYFSTLNIKHLPDQTTRLGPIMMKCTTCGEELPSRNRLFAHIREQHRPPPPAAAPPGPQQGEHTPTPAGVAAADSTCTPAPSGALAGVDGIVTFWEDDWLIVFVKPQGMATMSDTRSVCRSDALLLSAADAARSDVRKAIPAHRLDKDTGGLLLCSKSKAADAFVKRQFQDRRVSKRYTAMVTGRVPADSGTIDLPLAGQQSCTKYEVLQRTRSAQYGWVTTVSLWPVTGRQHQLRRHMQMIGHHIVGERRYASMLDLPHDAYNRPSHLPASALDDASTAGLLYLWAVAITFPHPELRDGQGQPRSVELALPEEPELFEKLRRNEELSFLSCGEHSPGGQGGAKQGSDIAVQARKRDREDPRDDSS
jgi:23S rRNA-/tRNA-specific pseudouridylate synthase